MKFTTTITALNGANELVKFRGDNIESISFKCAQEWCDNNGKGYMRVDGILVMEMDQDGSNRTDYDFQNN